MAKETPENPLLKRKFKSLTERELAIEVSTLVDEIEQLMKDRVEFLGLSAGEGKRIRDVLHVNMLAASILNFVPFEPVADYPTRLADRLKTMCKRLSETLQHQLKYYKDQTMV